MNFNNAAFLEKRHHIRDGLGLEHVIGVKNENDVSLRCSDPNIHCRRLTAVLLEKWCNQASKLFDDLSRSVGRAVVNDNDFRIKIGLCECTGDGGPQES